MLTRRSRIRPAEDSSSEITDIQQTTTIRTRTRTKIKPVVEESTPAPVEVLKTEEEAKVEEVDQQSRIIAKYKERIRSPKTAMRAMCITCMGGYIAEVPRCTSYDCPLYAFRLGKNPYHKKSKPVSE